MPLFSALRYRNYQLFISGQAMSNVGNMVHQVAITWLAYTLTDSVFLLSVVAFSKQFATFLSGLGAGVIADRFNKQRLLQYAHGLIGANTLLLALLTSQELVGVAGLIAFQITLGLCKGMEMPSRQAFVNDLITDKQYLTNAIALNSTVFNTARVVGPAVAGMLIPWVGEAFCFLIYGLMSLVIIGFFFFIRPETTTAKKAAFNFKSEFGEGVRYAVRFSPIRTSILLAAGMALFGVSFMVLLPVVAGDIFGRGSVVYGYMNSALGVGAITGGIFLANQNRVARLPKLIFGAAIIFSLGLAAISFSSVLAFTLVAIALIGLGRVIVFAGTNTLLQTISEDDKRGRVLSLYITGFMGSLTLGGLLVGAIADWIGVLPTLLIEGGMCLVLSLWYATQLKMILLRSTRQLHRLEIADARS
ncbi:MAG: MFS transporter [Bacteroidota bacterium]